MIDLEKLRDQAEYDLKRGREWSTTSRDVLMLLGHIAQLEEKLKNKEAVQAHRTPLSGFGLAAVGQKHFGNPIPEAWYLAARELEAAHNITQEKQG